MHTSSSRASPRQGRRLERRERCEGGGAWLCPAGAARPVAARAGARPFDLLPHRTGAAVPAAPLPYPGHLVVAGLRRAFHPSNEWRHSIEDDPSTE